MKNSKSKKLVIFLISIMMVIITVLSGCVSNDDDSGHESNSQNDFGNISDSSVTDMEEFVDEEFLSIVEENELSQKNRNEEINDEMNSLTNSDNNAVDAREISEDYWSNEYPQTMRDYLSVLEKYKDCNFKDESLAGIAFEYIDSISVLADWYSNGANCGYDIDKRAYEALDKRVEICGKLQNNYGIDSGYSDKYFQVMTAFNDNKSDLQFSSLTEDGEDMITTVLKNNTDVNFKDFSIGVSVYAPSGEECAFARCVAGDAFDMEVEFNSGDESKFKGYLFWDSDEYDLESCSYLVYGYDWVEPDAFFEEY
ncbi:MAG: hypothetical protein ACI4S2_04270 [Lachnospiraceae bacterium]